MTTAAITHDIRLKATIEKWVDTVEMLTDLVRILDDDAGTFAAMGICLFDITNGSLPKDPRTFLTDLNQFLLSQEAEGDDDDPGEN